MKKQINKIKRNVLEFIELASIDKEAGYNNLVTDAKNKYPELFQDIENEYQQYIQSISSKEMAASLQLSQFIFAWCLTFHPTKVVDLGSGFSSYVFRKYQDFQKNEKITVYSVDDHREWLKITLDYIKSKDLDTSNILMIEEFKGLQLMKHFDIVLLDLNYVDVRKDLIEYATNLMNMNGVLIVDDVHKIEFLRDVKKMTAKKSISIINIKENTLDDLGRFSMLLKNG